MRRKGDPSQAIAILDERRREKWRVSNQRMLMAIKLVLEGGTSIDLQHQMREYAQASGDTHPGWFITLDTCRLVLEKARMELSKELSKNRATEYSKHQSRLEYLYTKAMKANDKAIALAVLKEQIALSERLFGVVQGGKKDGEIHSANRGIGQAITRLTEALAGRRPRRRRKSKKAASSVPDDADVSPIPGSEHRGDDLGAEVAEVSSDRLDVDPDQLDTTA